MSRVAKLKGIFMLETDQEMWKMNGNNTKFDSRDVNVCYHGSEQIVTWTLPVCPSASSQRQHEQQSGAVVLLRGSGSGGHDTWTDLLPEEIFRSTTSGVVRFSDPLPPPSVSSTVLPPNAETVLYTLETRLAVSSTAYTRSDLRLFCSVWFLKSNRCRFGADGQQVLG